jgi:hypothetical protein
MRKLYYGLVAICLIGFISCKQEVKEQKKAIKTVNVPTFVADSAYVFIENQVDFGPRYLSSPGWKKCGDFLVQKLQTYTPNVIEQKAPSFSISLTYAFSSRFVLLRARNI